MQVHQEHHALAAVRVIEPIDPASISTALPGSTVQVVAGSVEVGTAAGRCIASAGQWIVLDRRTGAPRAVRPEAYAALIGAA